MLGLFTSKTSVVAAGTTCLLIACANPSQTPGGDTASDSDDDGSTDPNEECDDIGQWSQDPPCGLSPDRVPLFVSIGFDDNSSSDGMHFALELAADRKNPDGSDISFSFYVNTTYAGAAATSWVDAATAGHEIGNHTDSHPHGSAYTTNQWVNEIVACDSALADLGLNTVGFRTPFLEYNDATFSALVQLEKQYDCSIEEGWHWEQDGTDYCWPYLLDNGSPGNDVLVDWELHEPISNHVGLWELPPHPVIVPPDNLCEAYGVPVGLRDKLHSLVSWFDPEGGKITGLDYNIYAGGMFEMNQAEFLATLKYTYDLRKMGNRAPMMFGAHSQYYTSEWNQAPNITLEERKQVLASFLDYVLQDDFVRVVSMEKVLAWCKDPKPLD
ncbi:MAG: polysaccharide deacetylase family protein [Myxococcota bacterium]|nr:polysaccharide deacetylase family protein [Myxococcota bacterium]